MIAQLGLVKILGLPQDFCFEGTAAEIIQRIASFLAVELPDTITNVVVGNSEPVDLQNTALWVRTDNSATFIGLYVVSGGAWVLIGRYIDYTPVFSGNGGMNWTATADIARYSRIGDQVTLEVRGVGTTSGVASNELHFTLPYPFAAGSTLYTAIAVDESGVGTTVGVLKMVAGSSTATVLKLDGTNWALGVDTNIYVSVTYKGEPL